MNTKHGRPSRSPLKPVASAGLLVQPSRAVSLPRADSSRTDSHASDRSACGLWDKTRHRGFCNGHIWGCGSSSSAPVVAPACLHTPRCRETPRAGIRQELPRQFPHRIRVLAHLLFLFLPVGLFPVERTSMRNAFHAVAVWCVSPLKS